MRDICKRKIKGHMSHLISGIRQAEQMWYHPVWIILIRVIDRMAYTWDELARASLCKTKKCIFGKKILLGFLCVPVCSTHSGQRKLTNYSKDRGHLSTHPQNYLLALQVCEKLPTLPKENLFIL